MKDKKRIISMEKAITGKERNEEEVINVIKAEISQRIRNGEKE